MDDIIKNNVIHDIIEIEHLIDKITPEEVGVILKLLDVFLSAADANDIHALDCDNYCPITQQCTECKIKNLCDSFENLRYSIYQLYGYMKSKGETE